MWQFLNKYGEETCGGLVLAVMAAIAFVNVVVRYGTDLSFAWSEEMTVNLFVWAVMLGTAAVFRERGHLALNIVYNLLPRAWRRLCLWLSLLLSVGFFAVLTYFGILEIIDEIELEVTTESMGIAVWWYTAATPLLGALIIVRIAQSTLPSLRSGAY